MMYWIVVVIMFVKVSEAGVPLPRKVVLNGDNLEILRLDIMTAEVRIGNNVKVMADRGDGGEVGGGSGQGGSGGGQRDEDGGERSGGSSSIHKGGASPRLG